MQEAVLLVMPIVGLLAAGSLGLVRRSWWRVDALGDPPRTGFAASWLERPWLLGSLLGAGSWMVLAFVLMLAVNLVLVFVEQEPADGWSMTAKTLDIGLIPLVLLYSRRLVADWLTCFPNFLEDDAAPVQRAFARRFEKVFNGRVTLLLGAAVGLVILAGEYQDGAFDQRSPVAAVVVFLASAVMTMLAGTALVIMVKGGLVIRKLGDCPIQVSASPYGVLSTGRMLVKAFAAATVAYLIAVSTMVLRTGWRPQLAIVAWVVVVAAVYVGVFIAAQSPIHPRMVAMKRERLERIERELHVQLEAFDRKPDKSAHDLIDALRKRRDEIIDLPDWPFNRKNLTGVLGLAISSSIPLLVKALFTGLGSWLAPMLVIPGAR